MTETLTNGVAESADRPKKKKKKERDPRNGLRTSATLATVLCVVGHLWLGFEQAWMDVIVALATGYATNLLFEYIDARANDRPPGFTGGGWKKVVDFLLSAHMTSITMSFILYVQDHWWAMAAAVASAIGSKFVFRVKIDGRYRHFFNPSNFGIALTLSLFPWATVLAWMYTADLPGWGNVILPLVALFLGTRLNLLYTKRIPTIVAFVVAFALQGIARSLLTGTPVLTEITPLTGFAVILFALYMITDPMTSPSRPRNQIIFGASVAFIYGALMLAHVTWALFYSVTLVAAARGMALYVESLRADATAPQMAGAQITELRTPATAVEGSSVGMSG